MAGDPYYNSTALLLHCDGTNGSTALTDNSHSPKTVTANGNAQIATSNSKWGSGSLALDGSGDYITAPITLNIRTQSFTMECWSYLTSISSAAFFASQDAFYAEILSGTFYVGDGSTNNIVLASHGIITNTWQHIALTFDGTTYRFFVDGVLKGSSTALLASHDITTMYYGGRVSQGLYNTGNMDDIRVTVGVARYTSNFSAPTASFEDFFGTVSLLLHCDGANGSTSILDSSLSAHTVTANGSVTVSTTQSKFNGASAHFPGTTSDYLSIPNAADLQFGSGNFTIEFFLYNSQSTFALIRKGTEWALTNDTNRWVWSVNPGVTNIFVVAGNVSSNTWTHVALVRNGSTTTLYVGGTAAASATSGNITDSTNPITIGDYNGSTILNGYIDELRIQNGVAQYTSNFTPPTAPFTDPGSIAIFGMSSTISGGVPAALLAFDLAGSSATVSKGDAAVMVEPAVSGVSVAFFSGAYALSADFGLSGLSTTTTLGAMQALSGIWFDIAGQSFTASGGAASVDVAATPGSAVINGQYGTFGVISSSTADLIGLELSSSKSQFGHELNLQVLGAAGGISAGTPVFTKFAPLIGAQAQTAKENPMAAISPGITGFGITTGKDTVWPAIGLKSLTAVITGYGQISKAGALVLNGEAIVANVGTAFPVMTKMAVGEQFATSANTLAQSETILLSGKLTAASINPLIFASSDKSSAIAGAEIHINKGEIYIGADGWYNFIRVHAVDDRPTIVLEDSHPDIVVVQLI